MLQYAESRLDCRFRPTGEHKYSAHCPFHADRKDSFRIYVDGNGVVRFHFQADYILLNDIDASATVGWNSGEGFEPIGTWSDPFIGRFDGRGHIISGLKINRSGLSYQGLFGYTASPAQVENIGLTQCNVKGTMYVGGLVGRNSATISKCYSTGEVSGETDVGGLVGFNDFYFYSSVTLLETAL